MLIIRDIFTAKPGQASKLANLWKKAMNGEKNVRVLTDAIGDFNTVIMETEVKDLAEFERIMEAYKAGDMPKGMDKETASALSKYTEMYQSGKREVYKIV